MSTAEEEAVIAKPAMSVIAMPVIAKPAGLKQSPRLP
jgi:hypothetical protein